MSELDDEIRKIIELEEKDSFDTYKLYKSFDKKKHMEGMFEIILTSVVKRFLDETKVFDELDIEFMRGKYAVYNFLRQKEYCDGTSQLDTDIKKFLKGKT